MLITLEGRLLSGCICPLSLAAEHATTNGGRLECRSERRSLTLSPCEKRESLLFLCISVSVSLSLSVSLCLSLSLSARSLATK